MNKRLQQQINDVKRDTSNPAMIDDVIETGLEAAPGNISSVYNHTNSLSGVEEAVVKNSTDGKTFNSK